MVTWDACVSNAVSFGNVQGGVAYVLKAMEAIVGVHRSHARNKLKHLSLHVRIKRCGTAGRRNNSGIITRHPNDVFQFVQTCCFRS